MLPSKAFFTNSATLRHDYPSRWRNGNAPVSSCVLTKDSCTCGVTKDAGDDPDVTNGYTIFSTVSLTDIPGVRFLPGEGVGTVTLPGIGIPVGDPAINPTPAA
ncbi:MAG: cobalt-precorrin-5B (C(1))-methyltransferase [Butyricimonas faecihominis]